MASLATRLFWAVPALRDVAATLKGLQLHRQRYGRLYHDTIATIETRDTWTRDALLAYQEEQLRRVVKHAVAHVPFYRKMFMERGLSADDIACVEDLRKLPMVSKADVRVDPMRLVDETKRRTDLIMESTIGTTGTPLTLYKTSESLQLTYAYFEARCRRPAGLQFGRKPYVMFGAQYVAPVTRTRPPFWCYNHVAKQLYMSVHHLAAAYLKSYCAEIRRRPYHAIMGYPSSLLALAQYVLKADEEGITFDTAITSGEVLYPKHRAIIEKAFECRVFDQYGCSENCVFAAECGEGNLHLSPEHGVVELLDSQGHPVPAGESGEIVCTGLINDAQPLIRYRVGDMGAMSPRACACGSPLPVLESVDGRTGIQAFVLPDGRRISRVGDPAAGVEGVLESQLVQEAIGRFSIRVVPAPEFSDADRNRLKENLRRDVGNARIDIELVAEIERTAAGKALFLISKVPGGQSSVAP